MNDMIFPDNYVDDIARVSASTNYFSPVLDQVFQIIEPVKKLLDIGCGTGLFANEAKKRTGCELHGIDGSPYAPQKAESMEFKSLTLIDDFNTNVLPFAANQFDFCLCKDLLEYLLDPEFVVKEAQRVLQKNGFLLAHVPNHFSFVGRLRFLFSNEIDTYNYFPGANRWNFPYIRFLPMRASSRCLRLMALESCRI